MNESIFKKYDQPLVHFVYNLKPLLVEILDALIFTQTPVHGFALFSHRFFFFLKKFCSKSY